MFSRSESWGRALSSDKMFGRSHSLRSIHDPTLSIVTSPTVTVRHEPMFLGVFLSAVPSFRENNWPLALPDSPILHANSTNRRLSSRVRRIASCSSFKDLYAVELCSPWAKPTAVKGG